MAPKIAKRKRNVLTLEQKGEIIEKMDGGWSRLPSFKLRHGFSNKKTHSEALNGDESGIDDFRQHLTELISNEGTFKAAQDQLLGEYSLSSPSHHTSTLLLHSLIFR